MPPVENVVIVYGGRFQPPHPGHYNIYKWLTEKFGKDNVYIATSNKTDLDSKNQTSPFDFESKKFLWTKLFGVPEDKIAMSKNPAFAPFEILEKFPEENTAYVAAVSAKDVQRYKKGKYFEQYPIGVDGNPLSLEKFQLQAKPYKEKGYYIVLPVFSSGISATEIRNIFLNDNLSDKEKYFKLKQIYGFFNEKIYNFMKEKIEKIKKKSQK